jgi:AcrR family transcriptional regulator
MAQTFTEFTISRDQSLRREALSRGRPRSEESEESILAATIQLLSEKPLRDISMEEIARKAGVGKATIYKWWPGKAYVALDAFLRKTNRMAPTADTGSVRRDILEQLRSLMVFYMSPAGHILGQFVAESQIDKEFASFFRERFIKHMREAVGVTFDRGVERGAPRQLRYPSRSIWYDAGLLYRTDWRSGLCDRPGVFADRRKFPIVARPIHHHRIARGPCRLLLNRM